MRWRKKMGLLKKKKEDKKDNDSSTDVIEANAIDSATKKKLDSLIADFNATYNNITHGADFGETALLINLQFAILGKLTELVELVKESNN